MCLHGMVHCGVVLLPGLVMLELGVGSGLDGEGVELVGGVSCEMDKIMKKCNL